MHSFWPKYKIRWVNMMFFYQYEYIKQILENKYHLKKDFFEKNLSSWCCHLAKKNCTMFGIYFHTPKFRDTNFWYFSITYDKIWIEACLSWYIWFILLIILAKIGAIKKVQKYPWKSKNINWTNINKKWVFLWLLHRFWSNKGSFPKLEC